MDGGGEDLARCDDLKLRTARTIKWNVIDRVSSQVLYAVTGIVLCASAVAGGFRPCGRDPGVPGVCFADGGQRFLICPAAAEVANQGGL